ARVLDYCAGGGGKTLALAGRARARIFAHDINPARMADLQTRVNRAGADVRVLATAEAEKQAPFDLVLCDVPCSGSGAWRRAPGAKWALTPEKLDALLQLQAEILDRAMTLVSPGGTLAYVTCSLLNTENQDQIDRFLANQPEYGLQHSLFLTPLDGGDGFFLALLTRAKIKL
ncbi:MAG: SAM-dependent methyltransferase, partial [Halocynthiibacter sp.]